MTIQDHWAEKQAKELQETTIPEHDRVLRWPEVNKRTGLCRSHIHDLAKKGRFPSPIKLGGRASGWLESEVNAWILERVADSRGHGGDAA